MPLKEFVSGKMNIPAYRALYLDRTLEDREELTASRDQPYITLDGEKKTGAYVPLTDDGRAHEIRFPIM